MIFGFLVHNILLIFPTQLKESISILKQNFPDFMVLYWQNKVCEIIHNQIIECKISEIG